MKDRACENCGRISYMKKNQRFCDGMNFHRKQCPPLEGKKEKKKIIDKRNTQIMGLTKREEQRIIVLKHNRKVKQKAKEKNV